MIVYSLWISFSKKSDKYVEGECEAMWNNMDNEGLGFGSLCLWAREDNPVSFKKIKTKSLNGSHFFNPCLLHILISLR